MRTIRRVIKPRQARSRAAGIRPAAPHGVPHGVAAAQRRWRSRSGACLRAGLGHRRRVDALLRPRACRDELAQLRVVAGVAADPSRASPSRTRPRAGRSRRRGCARRASWRARAANSRATARSTLAIARLRVVGAIVGVGPGQPDRLGRARGAARSNTPSRSVRATIGARLATELAVRERQPQDDLDDLLGARGRRARRSSGRRRPSAAYGLIGSIRMSSRAVTSRATSRATISSVSPTSDVMASRICGASAM